MARRNVFDDIAAEADKYGRLWESAKAVGDTQKAEIYAGVTGSLCAIIMNWAV